MVNFTVGQLRDLLDGVDDDAEVFLGVQPSYPFKCAVSKLRYVSPEQADIDRCREDIEAAERAIRTGSDEGRLEPEELAEARAELARLEGVPKILYILQGRQIDYASSSLWDGED
jgi:hypothetical protein